MTVAGEDLARVTVISPTRRIDLALPGAITLGEIMPNIVRFSGYEGGSAADVVHHWVLQRFGEDPLDVTRNVADLDIRDGDTLHLRQLEAAMPDAAFDDVVDAVATSTATQPGWVPAHSVRMSLLTTTAFLIGLPALLLVIEPGPASAAVALGLAFAAGLAAVLASRAFGRRGAATALGWMAVVLAGLGGFALLPGEPTEAAAGLPPVQVMVGSVLVITVAVAMALGAQVTPYGFGALACAALLIGLAQVVALFRPDDEISIAAVGVALAMGTTAILPSLSFRLARVAMPNLPSSTEQLMGDETPVQSDIVVRAVQADRILGGFLTASAIVVVLGTLVVLQHGSWFAIALGGCVALALILRSRSFVGLGHRIPLLIGGSLLTVVTLGLALMMMPGGVLRLLIGVGIAVVVALVLVSYAASYADKIPSPVLGRVGDVIEWLAILAIVPLTLAVLDLYAYALGVAG